jgi:hypothetical protein
VAMFSFLLTLLFGLSLSANADEACFNAAGVYQTTRPSDLAKGFDLKKIQQVGCSSFRVRNAWKDSVDGSLMWDGNSGYPYVLDGKERCESFYEFCYIATASKEKIVINHSPIQISNMSGIKCSSTKVEFKLDHYFNLIRSDSLYDCADGFSGIEVQTLKKIK